MAVGVHSYKTSRSPAVGTKTCTIIEVKGIYAEPIGLSGGDRSLEPEINPGLGRPHRFYSS